MTKKEYIYIVNINGASYIKKSNAKKENLITRIKKDYYKCDYYIMPVYSSNKALLAIFNYYIVSLKYINETDIIKENFIRIVSLNFNEIKKKCEEICSRKQHDPDQFVEEESGEDIMSDEEISEDSDSEDELFIVNKKNKRRKIDDNDNFIVAALPKEVDEKMENKYDEDTTEVSQRDGIDILSKSKRQL
jgi:hypothetical protein